MRRDLTSREDGFTLIEVLVVMSLFLLILVATLDAMGIFTRNNRIAELRSDQTEQARSALDRQARQLRNLAKRVTVPTINKASSYDLIFQTADPSRTWVRYCLDTTHAPATTARGRLWEMVSSSSTVPDAGTCPGATGAWASAVVVADRVVNMQGGADRPAFSYSCLGGATPCPPTDTSKVTSIGSTLYIDDDPLRKPAELRVSTAVFLRNQNGPPTASFDWTRSGTRKVLLNASGSSDPEGRTLRYFWYLGGSAPSFNCADGPPATPAYYKGVALNYTFPDTTPLNSTQSFTLVVCDPGDLKGGPVTRNDVKVTL